MKCLIETCCREAAPALKRGLCMPCYANAKRLVTEGKTTWDELVNMGLALSDSSANPFTVAFNKAKGGEGATGQ